MTSIEKAENWNGIKPAIVLYFDSNKPMPIREYRFIEYKEILEKYNVKWWVQNEHI